MRQELCAGLFAALFSAVPICSVAVFAAAAGMDFSGAYTGTLLTAIFAGILLAVWKLPLLAFASPRVAIYLAYSVVAQGIPWQMALGGAGFMAVVVVAFVSLIKRELLPTCIRQALMPALALLLILMGLELGRVLLPAPQGLLQGGYFADPLCYDTVLGVISIFGLRAIGVRAALPLGVLLTGALSFAEGFWVFPAAPFFLPEGLEQVAFQCTLPAWGDGVWGKLIPLMLSGALLVCTESAAVYRMVEKSEEQMERRGIFALTACNLAAPFLGSLPATFAPESAVGGACRRRDMAWGAVLGFVLLLFLLPVVHSMVDFPAFLAAGLIGAGTLLLLRQSAPQLSTFEDRVAYGICLLFLPLTKDASLAIGSALLAHVAFRVLSGRGKLLVLEEVLLAAVFATVFLYR